MVGIYLYGPSNVLFDQNECTICLEEFKKSDRLIYLTCRHIFHWNCLTNEKLPDKTSCPVCRHPQRTISILSQDASDPMASIMLLSLRILFEDEFNEKIIKSSLDTKMNEIAAIIITSFEQAVKENRIKDMKLCHISTLEPFISSIRQHPLYKGTHPKTKNLAYLRQFVSLVFKDSRMEACLSTCHQNCFNGHVSAMRPKSTLNKLYYLYRLPDNEREIIFAQSAYTEIESDVRRYSKLSIFLPLVILISCLSFCFIGTVALPRALKTTS